jgi:hypothetical protein
MIGLWCEQIPQGGSRNNPWASKTCVVQTKAAFGSVNPPKQRQKSVFMVHFSAAGKMAMP